MANWFRSKSTGYRNSPFMIFITQNGYRLANPFIIVHASITTLGVVDLGSCTKDMARDDVIFRKWQHAWPGIDTLYYAPPQVSRVYDGSMLLFGLTGGIASGKSTVAQHFVQLGCPVIDADRIARDGTYLLETAWSGVPYLLTLGLECLGILEWTY